MGVLKTVLDIVSLVLFVVLINIGFNYQKKGEHDKAIWYLGVAILLEITLK